MFHRSKAPSRAFAPRAVLLASIAALVAVTSFDAQAAPAARTVDAGGQQLAVAGDTDFSSRKRVRARRGNAAGLAMMGMVAGTIGAAIASQQRRDAYRRVYYDYPYGYGQPYAYRYRQPYAYGAPRGYHQPRVYKQPGPSFQQWHDRRQFIDPQNPNAANPTGVPRIGW